MNTDDKIRLLSGRGSWHTYSCNGELPEILMCDGPHGLRKQEVEDFSNVNQSEIATCFPTASAIASSWDTEVAATMANAIAKEAHKEKVSVVLGCGTNIKRSPLCGRNFEYFSEDPFLAGSMASSWISTMQSNEVGTSLKHFAGNNQETRRQTANSQIDERALREIYLSAFEKTVKEAQPLTIMASYNRLNGYYACANKTLLTDILRNEWGYKGLVVSDWGAVIDIVSCLKAGMDLEMPDCNSYHTNILKEALKNGKITIEEVEKSANRIKELVLNLSSKLRTADVDYKKQHEIAKQLECKSAVLLKNNGVLPLAKPSKIAVIGELAVNMRFQGGGSSHITTRPFPNAIDALQKKGMDVIYAQGYRNKNTKGMNANSYDEKLVQEAFALAAKATAEKFPILFFGGLTDKFEGEGYDRKSLSMPPCQIELMNELLKVNSNIVFVSFGGSPMTIPFKDNVNAILHMYLGGEAVGEAAAELLLGDVNPSGKLAETFPLDIKDTPCYEWFGKDSDDVEYRESIFVGYRYYETFNIPVSYEFGFGLSYTKFAYSNLKIEKSVFNGGKLKVSFDIQNIGKVPGAEVAQLYIINPKASYMRPQKELRGFTKLFLMPGETKTAEITLDDRSFSLYSVEYKKFIMPSGCYTIMIGSSVKNEKLKEDITVEGIDYKRNDRTDFPSYFPKNNKKLEISKEEFEKLYGKKLSNFDEVKKGEYNISMGFRKVGEQSLLGKITLFFAQKILLHMNRDKEKDDPAVKMCLQGINENPLESLVCTTNGMLPYFLAKSIVLAANGHGLRAIGTLIAGQNTKQENK